MANNENLIPIPGRLHSVATEGHVSGADEIYDDTQQKDQATINSELISAVGTGGSVDSKIATAKAEIIGDAATDYNTLGKLEDKIQAEASARESAVSAEVTRAEAAEEALDGRVDTLEEAVGSGGSVDERIAEAVENAAFLGADDGSAVIADFDPQTDTVWKKAQVLSAADKAQVKANLGLDTELENLRQLYEALTQSDIEVVNAVPVSGVANKIYRVVGESSYADYMFNANALTTPIKMAEYDNAIDDEPTVGSNNLVISGGVADAISKETQIDIDNYVRNSGVITPQGKWFDAGTHIVIEIEEGELYTITSNQANDSNISVLKTYSTTGNVDFSTSYNGRILFSGEIQISIPSDAHYLVVQIIAGDGSTDVKPQNIIKCEKYNFQEEFEKIEENISVVKTLNLDSYTQRSGVIAANGKWWVDAKGTHIAVPVNFGENYTITPLGENANVSIVKTYDPNNISSGVAVDFSGNYPQRNIITETTEFLIPSDAHYMIITILSGGGTANLTPLVKTITQEIGDVFNEIDVKLGTLSTEIGDISAEIANGNYDCIPFEGEPLSIKRNLLYITYFGGNIIPSRVDGKASQGCAIFGNIFYQLFDNGICSRYKLTNIGATLVDTFHLASYGIEHNHANSAQFSNVLSQSGNPLLYVADGYSKCYVEEVTENGSSLVQTITASIGQTNVNYKNLQIGDDGYMWLFGTEPSSGPLSIVKLRKVLISEGSSVTLTDEDIISQWSITWDFTSNGCQGGKIYDGKLFFVYSQYHSGNRGIVVIDTTSQEIVNNISFNNFTSLEIEDFDIYKESMIITSFDDNSHPLIKVLIPV